MRHFPIQLRHFAMIALTVASGIKSLPRLH